MSFSVIGSIKNQVRPDNTSTTGITVTNSLTLVNGDILYAFLGMGDDPGTGWTDSLGAFTQIANFATSSGNDRAFGVMRKIITDAAGEPASYTFQRAGNAAADNLVAVVAQTRGVDGTTPEDGVTPTTSSGSADNTPPNVTIVSATNNDAVLIAHLASIATAFWAARTAGAPSGYSLVTSESYNDSVNNFSIFLEVAYLANVGAAGTVTPGDWTDSPDDGTGDYVTGAVALRIPATAAGNPYYAYVQQ